MLTTTTVTVTTDIALIVGAQPATGVVIVNVGGLDKAGAQPGPDDAWLLVHQGDSPPQAFLLLSGASLALPGDLGDVFARAATTTTTLTYAVGDRA